MKYETFECNLRELSFLAIIPFRFEWGIRQAHHPLDLRLVYLIYAFKQRLYARYIIFIARI